MQWNTAKEPTVEPTKETRSLKFFSGIKNKLEIGSSIILKVSGAKTRVTYVSSDPKIAKVGKDSGVITCVGVGKVTKITLYVIPKTVGVKSLKFNKKGQVIVKTNGKEKGNDGYEIQYKYNGKIVQVKDSKAIIRTFKNLKSGKSFKVRIIKFPT